MLSSPRACRLLGLGAPLAAPTTVSTRATSAAFEYLLEPGSPLEFHYPSDPRGYFGPGNAIVSRVNSQGFRGREAAAERPPGSWRIAVWVHPLDQHPNEVAHALAAAHLAAAIRAQTLSAGQPPATE